MRDFWPGLAKGGPPNSCLKRLKPLAENCLVEKSKINLGLLAIDRAKVFQFDKAKEMVIDELTDSAIADPIDTEVLVIERVIKNLLSREAVFL